jgi:hypothetical protein
MKTFKIFSIAALALMMGACNNEDPVLDNNPATGQQIQFSATIAAPGSGATTRTIYTEQTDNGTIKVSWKEGDEIALIHSGKKDVVTVKTVNTDGSAIISGTITVGTNGEDVFAYYPAASVELNSDYNPVPHEAYAQKMFEQDGTLMYIQDNLDKREGAGKLEVSGNKASLSAALSLESQIAICKLTLQDDSEVPAVISANKVTMILQDETPVTLAATTTLSTYTSTVYLAVPAVSGVITVIANTNSDISYDYTNEDINIVAGKYYQSTLTLSPPFAEDLEQ